MGQLSVGLKRIQLVLIIDHPARTPCVAMVTATITMQNHLRAKQNQRHSIDHWENSKLKTLRVETTARCSQYQPRFSRRSRGQNEAALSGAEFECNEVEWETCFFTRKYRPTNQILRWPQQWRRSTSWSFSATSKISIYARMFMFNTPNTQPM